MTSQYRHRRTSNPATVFPNPLEPGEITVNTANRQIAVGDAASATLGTPKPLLAIRYFDTAAQYVVNEFVVNGTALYRSNKPTGPGAFTASDWVMMVGQIDPQYVAKTGDVMSGMLSLPAANPTAGVHATNKTYVDTLVASKSSVVVSDVKPTPDPIDSTLWYNTQDGQLYIRYNDGNSTAWVIAAPQPDAGMFIQRTGDTMSGPLVVPTAPTAPGHAASKAYVDAGTAVAVRYDSVQGLTPAQRSQARSNIDVTKKNYIVNGAMMVSQENGTGNLNTPGGWPADNFVAIYGNAGALNYAQVASLTPSGSPNRIRFGVVTADTSVAAGDYFLVYQNIEGLRVADLKLGTAAAKTFTLQFGVKAPAGTYCVTFGSTDNTRSYVVEYIIAAGEANTDVVKSLTITGDTLTTAGVWTADNNIGLRVKWCLMAGSSWQTTAGAWNNATNIFGSANQFNFMGTAGNVFELFDVSLTEGTVAPPFQVPDYASELAACKRYYRQIITGSVQFPVVAFTNGAILQFPMSPTMRSFPTISHPWNDVNYTGGPPTLAGQWTFLAPNVAYITRTGACAIGPISGVDVSAIQITGMTLSGTAIILVSGSGTSPVKFDARL